MAQPSADLVEHFLKWAEKHDKSAEKAERMLNCAGKIDRTPPPMIEEGIFASTEDVSRQVIVVGAASQEAVVRPEEFSPQKETQRRLPSIL